VKFLSHLSPETNVATRSLFYAVGIGGLIHFLALFVTALKEHNFVWFNPLFAVDFDRVFPGLKNNPLTFFGGWLSLALGAWAISKVIKGRKSSND
jgi:hypothetical protein